MTKPSRNSLRRSSQSTHNLSSTECDGANPDHMPVASGWRKPPSRTRCRGEHFNDGTIAKAIEDGSLLAAAERIVAALDEH